MTTVGRKGSAEKSIPHTRIQEDHLIKDTYEVGRKLGQGSFGKVHEAKHKETLKSWAIKSVNKEKAGSWALKLLEREVAILKRVHHPNIIQLNEVLESPKKMFLVMELCEGGELADILKEIKCYPEHKAKMIMKKLSSAISYLHKNDIVHRDIKLENILLSQNPDDPEDKLHIKVTDFGLSVVKGGVGHDNMMQDFCGTPMYMAPEIIDNKTYSQQCDVWAMGVIMYILLCGEAPFRSNDDDHLYDIIKKGEIDFSENVWVPISDEAKNCIEGMLELDPAHRLSAAEVLDHPWFTGQSRDHTQPRNVLEMMRVWGPELKKGGNCDDDENTEESAINGDSVDGAKESNSSTSDSSTQSASQDPAKETTSGTRKGSAGTKRATGSRTPPNLSSRTAASGRSTKPGPCSSTGQRSSISANPRPSLPSGAKTPHSGTTKTLPGNNNVKTANANNAKAPASGVKNKKK